jgi:hypothetical protein
VSSEPRNSRTLTTGSEKKIYLIGCNPVIIAAGRSA